MTMPPPAAPPPPPEGYQYGATAAARNDGKAVASLVCGIVGVVMCVPLVAIAAIVLGVMARKSIAASNGTLKGENLARWGTVLGIVGVVVGVVVAIVVVANNS
jgi:Domain of unknown function (DUF4190)